MRTSAPAWTSTGGSGIRGPGDVPREGDAQGVTDGYVPSGVPPDVQLENGEWIRRRPGASDHPQWGDEQHELVALLLRAGARQRLEERVVHQRHAVREERGVD